MSNEAPIVIVGNLTATPELRFIQSGAAVASFTVAQTPRKFDKATNAWVDQDSIFWRCSLWREQAEQVAESLQKGMRVIVIGEVKSRSWEADGQKRTEKEIEVSEIGPSLKYATAKVTRTQRSNTSGPAPTLVGPAPDPWASAPAEDAPPF